MTQVYKVYINEDLELSLTYLMVKSNFAKLLYVLFLGQKTGERLTIGPQVFKTF